MKFWFGFAAGAGIVAIIACTATTPQTAKKDLAGQIVFSTEAFEDGGKFETGQAFRDRFKTINKVQVRMPETTFKYYASFGAPLQAKTYYTQVYDLNDPSEKPVVSQIHNVKSPLTTQATGGWTFDIPEWPPPTDREIMENVWVKPGNKYRVVILKPIAAGEFSVSADGKSDATEDAPEEG